MSDSCFRTSGSNALDLPCCHGSLSGKWLNSPQRRNQRSVAYVWNFSRSEMACGGLTRMRVYRMMTSSNGNTFRVTGPLCGEFTGHRWIPFTKPVTRSLDIFIDLRLKNGWVNNREAGDLRRHRANYDVTTIRIRSQQWRPGDMPYLTYLVD